MRYLRLLIIGTSVIAVFVLSTTAIELLLRASKFTAALPRHVTFPADYFTLDPELGAVLAANYPPTSYSVDGSVYTVSTNEIGCYDSSIAGRSPEIYITGDSQTWAFAPHDLTWGARLGSLLKLDVATCGVPGFGSTKELLKSRQDLDRIGDPSLVIVGYYADDYIDDAAQERGTYNGYCLSRGPTLVTCWLYRHSILYGLFLRSVVPRLPFGLDRTIQDALSPVIDPNSVTPDEQERSLAKLGEFQRFAQERGARLLVVRIPTVEAEVQNGRGAMAPWIQKGIEGVESYTAAHDIPYLDLLPAFSAFSTSTPLYWKINNHMNITGNRLAGVLVAEYLIEHGLAAVPAPRAALDALKMERQALQISAASR